MSKKVRRRKDDHSGPEDQEPTKDEYNVAKWLRRNVKTKKTKFLSHNVEYFTSNKALDALMNSKFAEGENPLFPCRDYAINFMHTMLEHKFFHRAKKVPVYSDELKGGGKKKTSQQSTSGDHSSNESKSTKENLKEYKKDNANPDEHDSNGDATANQNLGTAGSQDENCSADNKQQLNKEKRKRKIKLDMHPDQRFVDGSEAYVWIYDPIPIHYWIFGLILVLGAIVVCLFPLWPPILRKGVYYLSIAAAGFLVFILVLTIIRLIVFVIIWILSGGKLYFWIFPNLTEDVGFFASFWPLYETKYASEIEQAKANKKSKKKKKDKDSDAEGDDDITPLLEEKIEAVKEHDAEHDEELAHLHNCGEENRRSSCSNDEQLSDAATAGSSVDGASSSKTKTMKPKKGSATESESESGSRSSTGKDFEIIDENDVDTS